MSARTGLLILVVVVVAVAAAASDGEKLPHVSFTTFFHVSHAKSVYAVAKAAAQRGTMRVTFAMVDNTLSSVLGGEEPPPGLEVINLGKVEDIAESTGVHPEVDGDKVAHLMAEIKSHNNFATDKLRKVWKGDQPDLVVADSISSSGCDTAELLGIPVAIIGSLPSSFLPGDFMYPLHSDASAPFESMIQGRLNDPAYPPGSIQTRALRLLDKLSKIPLGYLMAPCRADGRKMLGLPEAGQPLQCVQSGWKSAPLVIVTHAFGLEPPRPLPPNVNMVGPVTSEPSSASNTSRIGDPALESWITSEDSAILYAAFGTQLAFPRDYIVSLALSLMRAAEGASVRVLWSLPARQRVILDAAMEAGADASLGVTGEQMTALRSAINSGKLRIEPWVKQAAVLRHPSVRVFLSHCGAGSVNDASSAGIPIAGLPVVNDQFANCRRAERAGAAVIVPNSHPLKKMPIDSVMETTKLVLKSYKTIEAAAKRLGRLNRLGGGAARAAELIESAAIDGTEHLTLLSHTMPTYAMYNIDIWALVLVATIVILKIVTMVLRCMFGRCCGSSKKMKQV